MTPIQTGFESTVQNMFRLFAECQQMIDSRLGGRSAQLSMKLDRSIAKLQHVADDQMFLTVSAPVP